MPPLWVEGLVLGLATGPYCLTSCAPLLIPYLFSQGVSRLRAGFLLTLEFMAGRLLAYLAAGLLAGWAGSALAPNISSFWLGLGVFLSGLLLLAHAFIKLLPRFPLCGWAADRALLRRTPLLMGFFVGINICPPFVAGLSRAVALGSAAAGAVFFAAFFAGTSCYVAPMALAAPLGRTPRAAAIGTGASLLSGLWFTFRGLAQLIAEVR